MVQRVSGNTEIASSSGSCEADPILETSRARESWESNVASFCDKFACEVEVTELDEKDPGPGAIWPIRDAGEAEDISGFPGSVSLATGPGGDDNGMAGTMEGGISPTRICVELRINSAARWEGGEMDVEAAGVGEGSDSGLARGETVGASAGFSVAIAVTGLSEVVARSWFSTLTGEERWKSAMIGVADGVSGPMKE
jgi:hypothetical protein